MNTTDITNMSDEEVNALLKFKPRKCHCGKEATVECVLFAWCNVHHAEYQANCRKYHGAQKKASRAFDYEGAILEQAEERYFGE